MKVLFIGNSHTYFNDMPCIFKLICQENSIDVDVTMLAHGYKGLDFHQKEPEVRFNILYGNYDYIVLQHLQGGFDEQTLNSSVEAIKKYIDRTDSKIVLYMPWTIKSEREKQKSMSDAYINLAKKLNVLVAPVGLVWWEFKDEHPDIELYFKDDKHASEIGSTLAAYTIYRAIFNKNASTRSELYKNMNNKIEKIINTI